MFEVEFTENADNNLARMWTDGSPALRKIITDASHRAEKLLQSDPYEASESRTEGRRILFVAPLGLIFRFSPDGQKVIVLKIWLYGTHDPA